MQKIEYIPTEKLFIHPDNPRLIKDGQFKVLCESLRRNKDFFETRPILCNPQMVIFAGNMRYNAAKEVGMKEVPCAIMDISIERQREIMLRDNRQNGEWDWDILANTFTEQELLDVGFVDEDIMMGFGLSGAGSENVDDDRLDVLYIYPPEYPKLKDRASIHFGSYEEYEKAKKAIDEGKITAESILKMI